MEKNFRIELLKGVDRKVTIIFYLFLELVKATGNERYNPGRKLLYLPYASWEEVGH